MRYLIIAVTLLVASNAWAGNGAKTKKLFILSIGGGVVAQTVDFKNKAQCEAALAASSATFDITTGQKRVKHPTLVIYETLGRNVFTLLYCG